MSSLLFLFLFVILPLVFWGIPRWRNSANPWAGAVKTIPFGFLAWTAGFVLSLEFFDFGISFDEGGMTHPLKRFYLFLPDLVFGLMTGIMAYVLLVKFLKRMSAFPKRGKRCVFLLFMIVYGVQFTGMVLYSFACGLSPVNPFFCSAVEIARCDSTILLLANRKNVDGYEYAFGFKEGAKREFLPLHAILNAPIVRVDSLAQDCYLFTWPSEDCYFSFPREEETEGCCYLVDIRTKTAFAVLPDHDEESFALVENHNGVLKEAGRLTKSEFKSRTYMGAYHSVGKCFLSRETYPQSMFRTLSTPPRKRSFIDEYL